MENIIPLANLTVKPKRFHHFAWITLFNGALLRRFQYFQQIINFCFDPLLLLARSDFGRAGVDARSVIDYERIEFTESPISPVHPLSSEGVRAACIFRFSALVLVINLSSCRRCSSGESRCNCFLSASTSIRSRAILMRGGGGSALCGGMMGSWCCGMAPKRRFRYFRPRAPVLISSERSSEVGTQTSISCPGCTDDQYTTSVSLYYRPQAQKFQWVTEW